MGSYILSVSAAAVLSAVICAVSPGEGRSRMGKFVAFAAALTVALTILSPLSRDKIDFDFSLPEPGGGEEDAETVKKTAAECLAQSVVNTMAKIYSVKPGGVTAVVELEDGEEFRVKILKLYAPELRGAASEAEAYLSELYGCKIKVQSEELNEGKTAK